MPCVSTVRLVRELQWGRSNRFSILGLEDEGRSLRQAPFLRDGAQLCRRCSDKDMSIFDRWMNILSTNAFVGPRSLRPEVLDVPLLSPTDPL